MQLTKHHCGVLGTRSPSGPPAALPVCQLHNTRRLIAASAGSNSSQDLSDEDRIWRQLAFPTYLQNRNRHKPEVCREFDKAVTAAERRQKRDALGLDASMEEDEDEDLEPETAWHTIRREAERDAAAEPLLSSFLYASILAHDTFERALAFVLSNRLANAVMLPTQLFEIFHEVLVSEPDVREGALADVEACKERDPACTSYSQALLYYKGYHALQTHRIAHALWMRGQKVMATALQSRMSEVLAVDIHPAARLGRGILLDHGTGVVIGETAIIGNNVSLLQNVTLGGTGKEHGDRHPKISDNVLIGACATVLGNIRVGEGAQIAAGSLVLKPVAPHTMVAGSPAKQVGHVTGNPAEKMQQWSKKLLTWDPFAAEPPTVQPLQQQQQQQPSGEQQQLVADGRDGSSTPAAAAAAAAATPLPKPTKLSIAAAEAAWDMIAARVSAESGGSATPAPSSSMTSSSSGSKVDFHVHPKNGHSRNGNGAGRGLSSSSVVAQSTHSPSGTTATGASVTAQEAPADAARSSLPLPQQQQHEEVVQQPVVQQESIMPAVKAVPEVAVAGRKQASAELRGVHEGEVDATIDEIVAAEKWSSRREEPEYVI